MADNVFQRKKRDKRNIYMIARNDTLDGTYAYTEQVWSDGASENLFVALYVLSGTETGEDIGFALDTSIDGQANP